MPVEGLIDLIDIRQRIIAFIVHTHHSAETELSGICCLHHLLLPREVGQGEEGRGTGLRDNDTQTNLVKILLRGAVFHQQLHIESLLHHRRVLQGIAHHRQVKVKLILWDSRDRLYCPKWHIWSAPHIRSPRRGCTHSPQHSIRLSLV